MTGKAASSNTAVNNNGVMAVNSLDRDGSTTTTAQIGKERTTHLTRTFRHTGPGNADDARLVPRRPPQGLSRPSLMISAVSLRQPLNRKNRTAVRSP